MNMVTHKPISLDVWASLNAGAPTPVAMKPAVKNRFTGRLFIGADAVQSTTVSAIKYRSDISVTPQPPADVETFDPVEVRLAKLKPLERWRFLARHETTTFVMLLLSIGAWLFSISSILPAIEHLTFDLVSPARAQEAAAPVVNGPPLFTKENVLLAMLSIFVIWSLATLTFATAAEKIKLAGDTMKTLLGFLVGFFSTTKA